MLNLCKPLSKLDIPTLRKGRREIKNATEQNKNLSLARIRTLAHGFSPRCSIHWATVSVGRSWILILISFKSPTHSAAFFHVDVYRHVLLKIFFLLMSIVDSISNIAIFYICLSFFSISNVEFCKPLSKLGLPTLCQGSRERKNATEQIENLTLARFRCVVVVTTGVGLIFRLTSYFLNFSEIEEAAWSVYRAVPSTWKCNLSTAAAV